MAVVRTRGPEGSLEIKHGGKLLGMEEQKEVVLQEIKSHPDLN